MQILKQLKAKAKRSAKSLETKKQAFQEAQQEHQELLAQLKKAEALENSYNKEKAVLEAKYTSLVLEPNTITQEEPAAKVLLLPAPRKTPVNYPVFKLPVIQQVAKKPIPTEQPDLEELKKIHADLKSKSDLAKQESKRCSALLKQACESRYQITRSFYLETEPKLKDALSKQSEEARGQEDIARQVSDSAQEKAVLAQEETDAAHRKLTLLKIKLCNKRRKLSA